MGPWLRVVVSTLVITLILIAAMPSGWPESAAENGVMQGFPPPPDRIVDRSNWLEAPYLGWALQNMERIAPTATVDRGDGLTTPLFHLPLDSDRLAFEGPDAVRRTLGQFLEEQHVDAMLLWHRGSLLVERYRSGQTARTRHLMMSVTKSITGLMAEMLIEQRVVDDMRLVTFYLPELRGSAWEDASVREALDMEIGIDFREIYDDPWSDYSHLVYAAGLGIPPDGLRTWRSVYEFLPTLRRKGEHGMDFHHVTANTEVLGWIMSRASGRSLADLFADLIHGRMGAERDAFFLVDPKGIPLAGTGLGITGRDLLRLGIVLAQDGQIDGRQVIEPAVIGRIAAGGMRRASLLGNEEAPFNSYRSHWYIHHPTQSFSAAGKHGQHLYVAPREQVVLVMQSSHPQADGAYMQLTDVFFRAMVEYLAQRERP
jgi:CubicO group peptidase (beta-lactamase class C family)